MGKLPSVEELRQLVTDKIISQEEMRDILFNSETEEDRDKKSLESEIRFLRELVDKLSEKRYDRVYEIIKQVETPITKWDWYRPYQVWCEAKSNPVSLTCKNTDNTVYKSLGAKAAGEFNNLINAAFSEIETF